MEAFLPHPPSAGRSSCGRGGAVHPRAEADRSRELRGVLGGTSGMVEALRGIWGDVGGEGGPPGWEEAPLGRRAQAGGSCEKDLASPRELWSRDSGSDRFLRRHPSPSPILLSLLCSLLAEAAQATLGLGWKLR